MSLLKRWAVRIRSRARSSRPRARLLAAAAAAIVAVGSVWTALELGDGRPPWAAVGDGDLSPADLRAAADVAQRCGIPHRVESGRLLVPVPQAPALRDALTAGGLLGRQTVLSLEKVAGEGNIWETAAQGDRRWQAAVMATLSNVIGQFGQVRSATVLFDPGLRRGFGRPSVPPTASVKVAMDDGVQLSPRYALTIADFVAASVAGLDRASVHVVDDTGRSYRFDANGVVGPDDPIARLCQAEAYLREKVLETVRYIDNVIVGVCINGPCLDDGRRSASVGVPRSYLAAVYRAAHAAADDPNDAVLESFAAGHLAKIRQSVMNVIAAEDANAVKVDWYYEVPPASSAAAAAAADNPRGWIPPTGRAMASVSLALLGGLSGLAALRRRRKAGHAQADAPAPQSPPAAEAPADGDETRLAGPFEMLQKASAEELRALLHGEHFQTIALVLSHVEPTTAAKVLAAFDRDRQIEVSRRIAALAAVDVDVVAEAVRGLLSRRQIGQAEGEDRAGGIGRVARILHHAGYATEQAVLDGLMGTEPALAESIRKRMFVFEDVSELPREVLMSALESLGSDELAIALRTASRKVTERVLSGLSRDAVAKVRVEMERIGPVRLSDVEAAQERVISAVRRLEAGRYVSADHRKPRGVLA